MVKRLIVEVSDETEIHGDMMVVLEEIAHKLEDDIDSDKNSQFKWWVEEKEKELYVLIWDQDKGKHNKIILNHASNQTTEGELHFMLGQKVGEV